MKYSEFLQMAKSQQELKCNRLNQLHSWLTLESLVLNCLVKVRSMQWENKALESSVLELALHLCQNGMLILKLTWDSLQYLELSPCAIFKLGIISVYLNCNMRISLMIEALKDLTKGPSSNFLNHFVPICEMISNDHFIYPRISCPVDLGGCFTRSITYSNHSTKLQALLRLLRPNKEYLRILKDFFFFILSEQKWVRFDSVLGPENEIIILSGFLVTLSGALG